MGTKIRVNGLVKRILRVYVKGGSKMTKKGDKYETDIWIQSMFPKEQWFDPCPIDWHQHYHVSGLELDWGHAVFIDNLHGVFVNPPYSNPLPWVAKAIYEADRTGIPIVLLLKHDSSTEWYRMLHEAGANMLMINKRLQYMTKKDAAFPSVLFVL